MLKSIKPKIEKVDFAITSLEAFVLSEFDLAKRNRESSNVNFKLISSQNQYNGIYDDDIAASIKQMGGTDVYRKLTAQKCDSLQAWLNEILLPAMGESFWSIMPTPIPDLPEDIVNTVLKQAAISGMKSYYNSEFKTPEDLKQAQLTTIQEVDKLKNETLAKLREEASTRADKMQITMEDQLVDGNWENTIKELLLYYTIYPTVFLKGPIVSIKKVLKYDREGTPIVRDIPLLGWKAISPFDIYPSGDTSNVNEGKIFEFFKISRSELNQLKELPDYKISAIDEILRNNSQFSKPSDSDGYIKDDRETLENKSNTTISDSNIFDGIEMWGSISGYLLKEWGMNGIEDEGLSYEAHVILVDKKIIKATLNEDLLGRRPYYQTSYKPIPNSFYGISLPETMSDIARIYNATNRAICDNMALASGPMIAYDRAQMLPEEDITSIYPRKIFLFDGNKSMNTRDAVKFFQPDTNINQLLPLCEEMKREADNITNIPSFSMGNSDKVKGAGEALANYEKILTPKGSIEIGKIKVGDIISNTYGSQSKVIKVYPQGEKDIFRLKFSSGDYVDCDLNHRWSVSDHAERGFKTLTTKQLLKKGLFRLTPKGWRNPSGKRAKWCIPNIDYIEYPEIKVSIDPYTMGVLLGDGDSRCRITSEDEEIFNRIPYPLGKIDRKINENAYSRTVLGVKKKYHNYGLNCKSIYKFIPNSYLYNSRIIRLELLRGLMDTDGCCSEKGDVFFSTSSEALRDDFIRLVKSLGATSVSVIKYKSSNGICRGHILSRKENYRIRFNLDDYKVFHLNRKQKRIHNRSKKHKYITGVEYIGKYDATCIEVDSKDHLFVCDNYIPTHNTASGLSILQGNLTKGIKNHILNISLNILIPALKRLFDWNMLYNPDKNIKGDCSVVVNGPLKVITKEQKQVRINEILQISNNPTDLQIMGLNGRKELWEEVFKINDIPYKGILPEEDITQQAMPNINNNTEKKETV